jgi:uncharacterized protein YjeT (DUF2065 family)
MGVALVALGLVLVAEGLLYALAPWLVEDLLATLRAMTPGQRRLTGLLAVTVGLVLIVLGRMLGASLA